MAGLVGRRGTCPLPGVPLSVKTSRPGSPVRSLGWSVMVQPVGSPIRLCPRDVTRPTQSLGANTGGLHVLRARSVLSRTTEPEGVSIGSTLNPLLATPPPPPSPKLSTTVLLRSVVVPFLALLKVPPPSNLVVLLRAMVLLMTTRRPPFPMPPPTSARLPPTVLLVSK